MDFETLLIIKNDAERSLATYGDKISPFEGIFFNQFPILFRNATELVDKGVLFDQNDYSYLAWLYVRYNILQFENMKNVLVDIKDEALRRTFVINFLSKIEVKEGSLKKSYVSDYLIEFYGKSKTAVKNIDQIEANKMLGTLMEEKPEALVSSHIDDIYEQIVYSISENYFFSLNETTQLFTFFNIKGSSSQNCHSIFEKYFFRDIINLEDIFNRRGQILMQARKAILYSFCNFLCKKDVRKYILFMQSIFTTDMKDSLRKEINRVMNDGCTDKLRAFWKSASSLTTLDTSILPHYIDLVKLVTSIRGTSSENEINNSYLKSLCQSEDAVIDIVTSDQYMPQISRDCTDEQAMFFYQVAKNFIENPTWGSEYMFQSVTPDSIFHDHILKSR